MREAIDAFVATIQPKVTGEVRIRLFKGEYRVVGRRSPFALYDHSLATYDAGDRFDHTAAVGFINLWGLPVETVARQAAKLAELQPAAPASVDIAAIPSNGNGHGDGHGDGKAAATLRQGRSAIVADWVGL
jgi:argininosuccinate synthase